MRAASSSAATRCGARVDHTQVENPPATSAPLGDRSRGSSGRGMYRSSRCASATTVTSPDPLTASDPGKAGTTATTTYGADHSS